MNDAWETTGMCACGIKITIFECALLHTGRKQQGMTLKTQALLSLAKPRAHPLENQTAAECAVECEPPTQFRRAGPYAVRTVLRFWFQRLRKNLRFAFFDNAQRERGIQPAIVHG